MPKVQAYIFSYLLLLFIVSATSLTAQYKLLINGIDKDAAFINQLKLQKNFPSKTSCQQYIYQLPLLLQKKGYAAASVDSVRYDSSFASISLFTGSLYKLAFVSIAEGDKKLMSQLGFNEKLYFNKPLRIDELQQLQQRVLDNLENNGYPFAAIQLDSLHFNNDELSATIKINKGPLYHIDSIRIYGNSKISNTFMQRYLGITNGTIYQKEKLQQVSQKIMELPYLQEQQPWSVSMLGTGSILNLYLQPKKASQVNVLIGLLPNNQQLESNKLLLTGEANINLRNALGNGETIGLNWQQLQVKSPRLNILFQQPFLFASPFGLNASFNLLKKDSSYLNIDMMLGLQYAISTNKTGRVFFQSFRSNLLAVDTSAIKASKQLPQNLDLSIINLGVDYETSKTNYRLNPRRGREAIISLTAGTRKIRKNNIISDLKQNGFSYDRLYDTVQLSSYQFKVKAQAAQYVAVGQQSAIKFGVNAGFLQSPSLYNNELFQIGGYRLLRGFDEESIYASQYLTTTIEYRYLLALNSYFFGFADVGFVSNRSTYNHSNNNYIGAGVGMSFETKAGLINISFAAGKRNDLKLDLRQTKVHLGFVSYF